MSSPRNRRRLAVTAAVLALAAPVAAQAQTLTRIETHSFYGATVTIEEGVRVFRPLPPTSHMIINPGGRTPLSINYNTTIVDVPPAGADSGLTVSGARGRYGLWSWGGNGRLGRYGALRRHPGLHRVGHGGASFLRPMRPVHQHR